MITGQWARWRRLVSAGALLLASLTCSGSVGAARTVALESTLDVTDPAFTTGGTLPPGFAAAVDAATAKLLVRVVAYDIDNDGDLDIVANDGTLELLVWENDGTGHFARKSSGHLAGLEAPPPETVFGDPFASSEAISNDGGHGLRLERLPSIIDTAPETVLSAGVHTLIKQARLSVRSPRAPPVVLPL